MRIDGKTRRSFKKAAKKNLRQHYWTFVLMCMFAVLIGAEFVTSDNLLSARTDALGTAVSGYEQDILDTEEEVAKFAGASTFSETTRRIVSNVVEEDDQMIDSTFARTSGTLNQVIDYFTSGTIVSTISSVVLNIVGSPSVANVILLALSVTVGIAFWMFVQNVFSSVLRRVTLEGRIYKTVPYSRFLMFIRNRRWFNAALALAIHSIFVFLSLALVIPFPIIFYGLFLMPFILAENPEIKPMKAVKLSWDLMKGHKWDLFVTDVTLIGWYILGVITFGLSNFLFANPYRIAVYSEFYAHVRKEAISNDIAGSELLNDRYLYEKCDMNRLRGAYPEAASILSTPEYKLQDLKGAKKFFAEHFGVVLWNTKDEMRYEENQAGRQRIRRIKDEAEGLSYPTRLSGMPDSRKRKGLFSLHYMRHYSVLSLVLMFFIYSGFGWVWEVIYYFMLQGHFINRGVLHGPWLPIYGAGGLGILIFLFPLRKSPARHFFATMALCGAMEYFTSVILEYAFGKLWWSYDGFFLNLNGRICAEGLLVFGIAGLAFIYFLSPMIDDVVRKIDPKKLLPIAVILLTFFIFDVFYSNAHPNTGDGITDGFAGNEHVAVEQTLETAE